MNAPERNEPIDEFLKKQFGDKPEDRTLEDPSRAGEINRRLRAEPSPEGVYAPITLARPTDVAPVAYVLHNFTTRCTMCNTEHRYSEMYALNHLKTRTGAGKFIRHLVPIQKLDWNVPLVVHNLSTKTVAGCFECFDAIRDTILPTLQSPPVPEAIMKTSTPEGASSGPARRDGVGTPKKPLSTDDFMV